jgi:uncharacterized protein (TIGR00730 family)
MPEIPNSRRRTAEAPYKFAIRQLLDEAEIATDRDLVESLISSAIQIGQSPAERLDLKVTSGAVAELALAYEVFVPYRGIRKAAMFGSARTEPTHPLYALASQCASAFADAGWMVITGAGPGIMQAALDGAGANATFGVGIKLPYEPSTPDALVDDPKMVSFRYFFARKLTFLRESSCVVAFPGGFGTLDEVFESLTLLQTGKTPPVPVILVDTPGNMFWARAATQVTEVLAAEGYISPTDNRWFEIVDSPESAVEIATNFYRNYQSLRFVKGELVLRMKYAPGPDWLEQLHRDFEDCVLPGSARSTGPTEDEIRTSDSLHLERVVFSIQPPRLDSATRNHRLR